MQSAETEAWLSVLARFCTVIDECRPRVCRGADLTVFQRGTGSGSDGGSAVCWWTTRTWERHREREGKKKKRCQTVTSHCQSHFSLTPSLKSIKGVKSLFQRANIICPFCRLWICRCWCLSYLPDCFLRKRPHPHSPPQTKTLQRGKRSITQLDVWAAASAPEQKI